MLLMAEMTLFMFLVLPMPFAIKRRLFTYGPSVPCLLKAILHVTVANRSFLDSFISENPLVAKLQYGLKITFIFILILFIDSVNRVYRVQVELSAVTDGGNNAYVSPMSHISKALFTLPSSNCSTRQRT